MNVLIVNNTIDIFLEVSFTDDSSPTGGINIVLIESIEADVHRPSLKGILYSQLFYY